MSKVAPSFGLAIFIFIFIFRASANVATDMKFLMKAKDDLGMRIYVKKTKKKDLNSEMLNAFGIALLNRPNVGYDLISNWEKFSAEKLLKRQGKTVVEINGLIQNGHTFYGNKNYSEAFKVYQSAARMIKKIYKGSLPLYQEHIYYIVVHQMARCLYSMKRFGEATDVYQWIPRSYYQFRQVLFEKMWAAFRANRVDVALGAMASQQSGYFSKYLEPEAYLLRIYLLKQLCYDDRVQKTVAEVSNFLKSIEDNQYTMSEWAKNDIEIFVLQRLLEPPGKDIELADFINSVDRENEKQKIEKILKKRFTLDKERLKNSLKKVIGYSKIIINSKTKDLKMINSLPTSSALNASAKDLWVNNDPEEWIDELGGHYFVGKSKCKK